MPRPKSSAGAPTAELVKPASPPSTKGHILVPKKNRSDAIPPGGFRRGKKWGGKAATRPCTTTRVPEGFLTVGFGSYGRTDLQLSQRGERLLILAVSRV